jgi:colanic acid biosynthesis glycosyl transferase WcaI
MNIVFLTENFFPETNAAASRVYERACYWVSWGHKVTVITTTPNFPTGKVFSGYKNNWLQQENIEGIQVVRVKTYIAANEGFLHRVIDFISFMIMGSIVGIFTRKPDIIVATSPQFFTAVAGWFVSVVKMKPFIFELSDLWPSNINALDVIKSDVLFKVLTYLELFLYAKSKKIIALTPAFKYNLMKRGISPNKITVILNGAEIKLFQPKQKSKKLLDEWKLNNKFIVGYIGTMGMAHGLENVLNAAKLLKEELGIHFVLIGAGADYKNLKKVATVQKIKNVSIFPQLPKRNMPDVISSCDLALVSLRNISDFKTVIPSKLFEAMAMGKPQLLVAPIGEAKKIIEKTGSGVWVPPENPQQLSETIKLLMKDKDKLKELSTKSILGIKDYTREKQARLMINALEESIC